MAIETGKNKPFIVANVREIVHECIVGENISFGKMVELFNEVAERFYASCTPDVKGIVFYEHKNVPDTLFYQREEHTWVDIKTGEGEVDVLLKDYMTVAPVDLVVKVIKQMQDTIDYNVTTNINLIKNLAAKSSAVNPTPSTDEWVDVRERILLTEENIMTLRRVEREDFRPLEFRKQEPGERQGRHFQYWSNWIHEDYKIHLCPSYKTEWIDEKTPVTSKEIDFWYIWYCEGNRSLPLMDIRKNKLLYVDQLQDIMKCIIGKEIILPAPPKH